MTATTAPPRARRDGEFHARPNWTRRGSMVTCPPSTIVASAIPVAPPPDWFDNPKLGSLTGLTVEDNGRVFGHVAGWRTSHIGMAGSVRAPRSRSDYAFFKSGVLHCDDGSKVDVGQITLTGGHAPLTADAATAVKHYDDTNSAVMDVNVGEDKHGIWIAGALRPDVTPAQLRSIRASGISGDWRPIDGKNELVAICSVPVPGFPIPRALVAGGEIVALVAAGSEQLVEMAMERGNADAIERGITAATEPLLQRLERLESTVLERAASTRVDVDAAVTAAASDGADPREQLRRRVHKTAIAASAETPPAVQEAQVDAPTPEPDVLPTPDELRARVYGIDASGKTISKKDHRGKLASRSLRRTGAN